MTQQQLCQCIGIEIFLNRDEARKAARARRAHVAAVLLEQRRQKHFGICDPVRLAIVSELGSYWTKERARKLAIGYAALCKESKGNIRILYW